MCSIKIACLPILVLSLYVTLVRGSPVINSRIYGGQEAAIGQFPYAASMRMQKGNQFVHFCGGSIISEQFVVTAAHCILDDITIKVFIGAHTNDDGQMYELRQILVHEEFDLGHNFNNDIAVIKLTKPIEMSTNVASIKLNRDFIVENIQAVTVGWGMSDDKNTNLKFILLNTLTFDECRQMYEGLDARDQIDEFSNLCAYSSKGQASNGDSGGPLVYNNSLIGLTSWGDSIYPVAYTRVSKYFEWIENAMTSAL